MRSFIGCLIQGALRAGANALLVFGSAYLVEYSYRTRILYPWYSYEYSTSTYPQIGFAQTKDLQVQLSARAG